MPLPAWIEPWLPKAAPPLIRALGSTWQIEQKGVRYLNTSQKPKLFAVWHGRQLPLTAAIPTLLQHGPAAVMTSASRDGRVQAEILSRLGLDIVVGSSSRFGERALVQLARKVSEGCSVIVAVDGPSGPVYCAKSGIALLSRLTGAPMIPVGVRCHTPDHLWIVPGTWDQFWVPAPRAHIEVRLGPPITSPQRGREALADTMDTLQRRMSALNGTTPRSLRRKTES